MKNIIEGLNKHFENRSRLGIMSILVVNEWTDFNTLKELLHLTDGNLASHLNGLEKNKYIKVKKQFVGKKPNTQYCATPVGIEAFKKHLSALEELIKEQKQ